jgi:hypothetical protein
LAKITAFGWALVMNTGIGSRFVANVGCGGLHSVSVSCRPVRASLNMALQPAHRSSAQSASGYAGHLFTAHGETGQYMARQGRGSEVDDVVMITGLGMMGGANCGGWQSVTVNALPLNLSTKTASDPQTALGYPGHSGCGHGAVKQ